MELKSIRLFVTLADELHFGKAARRAGVTQSVLSVQIKRLEDVLGTPLFARTTREVRLTEVGVTFREEAEGILRRVDQAIRAARATARGKGRLLRIGITTAVEVSDAMDRIASFRTVHPDIQVLLRELGSVEQEAALVTGDIDIGILHPPVDQTDLSLMPMSTDPFLAVYDPRFYQLEGDFTWEHLLQQPLVFYPRRRAPRLFDHIIGIAQTRNVTSNIMAEAESFFAAFAMAQAGLGIALLPQSLLHLKHRLTVRPLPRGASLVLETACAVHSSTARDDLIQVAAKHIVGSYHGGRAHDVQQP